MKKLCSLILVILTLVSLAYSVSAAETDAPQVVDNARLLSDAETESLTQQIQILREELELEIVIVTTYGTGGENIRSYADDFYDSHGYGYGSDHTGILLLVDMESREWYISTCGEAIYIFTDYALEQLGDAIVPWLSEGNFYRGFETWADSLGIYVNAFRAGSPIDGYVSPDAYYHPDNEVIYYDPDPVNPFPVALAIGLIAALVTVLIMRSTMNTAKRQSGASDYLKDNSFRLRQRSDMFLYSRVSKKPRPQNNTSGGGSSVHRSSGGVSHGGRGGKF